MLDSFIAGDNGGMSFQALAIFLRRLQNVGPAPAGKHTIVVTCRYGNAFVRETAQMSVEMAPGFGSMELTGCKQLTLLKFPLSYDTFSHHMKIMEDALVVIGSAEVFGDYMLWIRREEDQAALHLKGIGHYDIP